MSQIATPISNLFKDQSDALEIASLSDCLEGRDHKVKNTLPKQFLFHFECEIVHPLNRKTKEIIEYVLITRSELKLISFHMASSCSDPHLIDNIYYPRGKDYTRDEMTGYAKANIRWIKELIKDRDIQIAVENNNYYATPAYQYITDPDFINEVVSENDCKFLFDLAHARISAINKEMDFNDYISGLPLGRMIQMHVSKHTINEHDIACDSHILPDDKLFEEVSFFVSKYNPQYITIEYYKDKDNLLNLLRKYKSLTTTEMTSG